MTHNLNFKSPVFSLYYIMLQYINSLSVDGDNTHRLCVAFKIRWGGGEVENRRGAERGSMMRRKRKRRRRGVKRRNNLL